MISIQRHTLHHVGLEPIPSFAGAIIRHVDTDTEEYVLLPTVWIEEDDSQPPCVRLLLPVPTGQDLAGIVPGPWTYVGTAVMPGVPSFHIYDGGEA